MQNTHLENFSLNNLNNYILNKFNKSYFYIYKYIKKLHLQFSFIIFFFLPYKYKKKYTFKKKIYKQHLTK